MRIAIFLGTLTLASAHRVTLPHRCKVSGVCTPGYASGACSRATIRDNAENVPGGARWIATHEPTLNSSYVSGACFDGSSRQHGVSFGEYRDGNLTCPRDLNFRCCDTVAPCPLISGVPERAGLDCAGKGVCTAGYDDGVCLLGQKAGEADPMPGRNWWVMLTTNHLSNESHNACGVVSVGTTTAYYGAYAWGGRLTCPPVQDFVCCKSTDAAKCQRWPSARVFDVNTTAFPPPMPSNSTAPTGVKILGYTISNQMLKYGIIGIVAVASVVVPIVIVCLCKSRRKRVRYIERKLSRHSHRRRDEEEDDD